MKLRVQAPDGLRVVEMSSSGVPIVAGRGDSAQLRLPDPERALSREHLEFRWIGGIVRMTVLSKVGGATSSRGAVGPGKSIDLAPGDSVTLGAYTIAIEAGEPPALAWPAGPEPALPAALSSWLTPAEIPPISGGFQLPQVPAPGAGSFSRGTDSVGSIAVEALPGVPGSAGSEADRGRSVIDEFVGRPAAPIPPPLPPIVIDQRAPDVPPWTTPDRAEPTPPQPPSLPGPLPGPVPGDWAQILDQIQARPSPTPASPLPPAATVPLPPQAPPVHEGAVPSDPPPTPQAPGFDAAAFSEGLGVAVPASLSADDWRRIGATLRQLTDALNQLMLDRAALKGELRALNKTQVYMSENNPYKARMPIDQLLEMLLFAGEGANAFMPADAAVREAIDDLRAHNLAIIAASRASVAGTVREFSPDQLKRHLSTGKAARLVAFMEHGQLWKSYLDYYQDKSTHMADWLEALFERHFVDAYSREADRLSQQHIALP